MNLGVIGGWRRWQGSSAGREDGLGIPLFALFGLTGRAGLRSAAASAFPAGRSIRRAFAMLLCKSPIVSDGRPLVNYYISKYVDLPYDEAVVRTRQELKNEGFGVLTEIDVKATLKAKINVDFRPYIILGACNPEFAWKALQSSDKVGVLLPCNVIVSSTTTTGSRSSRWTPLDHARLGLPGALRLGQRCPDQAAQGAGAI